MNARKFNPAIFAILALADCTEDESPRAGRASPAGRHVGSLEGTRGVGLQTDEEKARALARAEAKRERRKKRGI